jgi:GntR family transcriptional regulator
MNEISTLRHPVDETLAVPLYHQVYLILRENIRSGVYRPGTALPSETLLCNEFDVSRITVKRAMRDLVSDGLVVRQRGKGTFVADIATAHSNPDALNDLLQNVQAIGAATEVEHLNGEMVVPVQDIGEKLAVEDGGRVLKSSHLRLSEGQPLAVIITYVPADVAERLDPATERQPMLVRLSDAGLALARADQEVTATLAEPAIAVQLGIEVGSPLLKLTRLVFDNMDKPVEWLTALYRADRYAVRTSLTHETVGRHSTWRPAAE